MPNKNNRNTNNKTADCWTAFCDTTRVPLLRTRVLRVRQPSSGMDAVTWSFLMFEEAATGSVLLKTVFSGSLFNKVVGLRTATLLKKRLWYWCFTLNFAKSLRTLFFRAAPGDCFCVFRGYRKRPVAWNRLHFAWKLL